MSIYEDDGSAPMPAATGNEALPTTNAQTQDIRLDHYSDNGFSLPLYESINATQTSQLITLNDLADLIHSPSIGAKAKAKAFTPFKASGKQKEHALSAQFYALIVDHDHDDLTREQLTQKYDAYMVNYFAFTSSNHL